MAGVGQEIDDSTLYALAQDIGQHDVVKLGLYLGFSTPEIERYKATNTLGDFVTTKGTAEMLFQWKRKTARKDQYITLATALQEADLKAQLEKYFPKDSDFVVDAFAENSDFVIDAFAENNTAPNSPRMELEWIGSGAYSEVYRYYDWYKNKYLAVKKLKTGGSSTGVSEEVKSLMKEVELLRTLEHCRIVQYFRCTERSGFLYIFMEYMSGHSVKDILKNGALSDDVTRKYTKQVLEGVVYLHERNIIHRDIKGANILEMNGNIKLADFGVSKQMDTVHSSKANVKSFMGTVHWMSPEVVKGEIYGRKTDIWSIGCTVIEMLTTKPPFAELEQTAAIFKIGTLKEPPLLPTNISNAAKEFLSLCLKIPASERPTAVELSQHCYLMTL